MEEEYIDYGFSDAPSGDASFSEYIAPVTPEALISPERYAQVPLLEYALKDLQPIRKHEAYSTKTYDRYFDPDDFESSYDRRLFKSQKEFLVTPREGDIAIWVTNAYEDDFDDDMYHLIAWRKNSDPRLISPAFHELLESTPTYIRFRIYDRIFQLTLGTHIMAEQKKPLVKLPDSLDQNRSVLFSELIPLESSEQTELATLPQNHWEILDAPAPSALELEQIKEHGNQLFDMSVLAIYNHIERNPLKYAGAEDSDNALHLPAIPLNGKYYQVTVSSSEISTVLSVQRVHPESPLDDIGNALEHISVEDFTRLLENPEELERVMTEALSDGKLLLAQRPYSDVLIVGGDDYDKRVEYKDAAYATIVTNVARLIKSYLEQLDTLTLSKETLHDKRKALAEKVRAEQAAANKPEGRLRKFGKLLFRLFIED